MKNPTTSTQASRFAAMLLTLLGPPLATAQDHSRQIDAICQSIDPQGPGCVIAVAWKGELVTERAYGLADLERNVPLSPESVFDVGSLVKQFVATAILLLVDEGTISLDADIREFIPELPDTGHTISVDHLLTHTSGVRDWTGIAMLSNADEDALTMILRQRGLNFAPGEEWSYSNSGYVLLKEMIGRSSGMSFAAFAKERLFDPLGMTSTRYIEDLNQVIEHRVLAYERAGEAWKHDVLVDNDRGGGGALMSTAGDLIKWNAALASNHFGAFVTNKLHEPARLNCGRELDYARGLFLDTNGGGPVIWHTGSAAAYKSMLSRYPDQQLSIALLCNGGDQIDRMQYVRPIFELFLTEEPRVASEDDPHVQGIDVRSRAGLFLSEGAGRPLRLMARGGRLMVAGGPPLATIADDRFRNTRSSLRLMSGDQFQLHFLSDDQLELTTMEGSTTRYARVKPSRPEPGTLQPLVGKYHSVEIGSTLQVDLIERGLGLRIGLGDDRAAEFKPVGHDTFLRGPMTVRFQRDESGAIVGLRYSNPMLRGIMFARADS